MPGPLPDKGAVLHLGSLSRGTNILVVLIQIAPVHCKFDVELCGEIN